MQPNLQGVKLNQYWLFLGAPEIPQGPLESLGPNLGFADPKNIKNTRLDC